MESGIHDRVFLKRLLSEHSVYAFLHFARLKALGESVSQPLHHYESNAHGSQVLLHAMQIVLHIWGLEVGLGSNRASSFVASLVRNTGVLGALFFVGTWVSLLWRYFRAQQLSGGQIFAGLVLFGSTLYMVFGVPDLNLPIYWVFIMLAFVLCPLMVPRAGG